MGFYGLILEAVYTVTSATFEKKKKKRFETNFGSFSYRDVPSKAFPLGIRLVQEREYFYRIAEPEKALCDQLYTISPVGNTKELFRLLTEGLHIEESELKKLDASKVCAYSAVYHTTNIKKLYSLMRRIQYEHKYRLLPVPYVIRLYDMLSLFAGKIHAVICRGWQSRLDSIDFLQARKDVEPFICDTSILDIWSSEIFKQITEGLKVL